MAKETLAFDFDFGGQNRTALLNEASDMVRGLAHELGGPEKASKGRDDTAATGLLKQLEREVARFGDYPDVLQLNEKDFTARGLQVPVQFADLERDYSFYWTRVPLVLNPLIASARSR